jgi:glycerophosphoryl diester phosphodiesterase
LFGPRKVPTVRLIAHRGFAGVNPENTLTAVGEAAAVADAVEVDVRRCATGELVVIHDETVDRVTDGEGPVADHSLAELRELDVLETGGGVPTLEAVLEAVPRGVGVNVELKEPGTAADALSLTDDSKPWTVVSSFSADILSDCRAADPSVPRAFVTEDGEGAVETARELDCDFLHPSTTACTGRLVGDAHHAGMSVNAWTVRDRETAESLAGQGVDGLIADRPDVRPEGP